MVKWILVIALVVGLAGRAAAWPTGEQFDGDPVVEGGGGGKSFTGAPRWAGHDCAVCHTDPARQVRLRVDADPVTLFSAYQPGQTYRLRVALAGEHLAVDSLDDGDRCLPAFDVRCDDNGFALEIDDEAGQPVGELADLDATGGCGGAPAGESATRVLAAGDAIVHSGYHHGVDAWTFCWTAPTDAAGPLVLRASAVDGNGGEGTSDNPVDLRGDDVVTGAVPLVPAGGEAPELQSGGCASGGAGGPAGALLVLAAWAVLRRRFSR